MGLYSLMSTTPLFFVVLFCVVLNLVALFYYGIHLYYFTFICRKLKSLHVSACDLLWFLPKKQQTVFLVLFTDLYISLSCTGS